MATTDQLRTDLRAFLSAANDDLWSGSPAAGAAAPRSHRDLAERFASQPEADAVRESAAAAAQTAGYIERKHGLTQAISFGRELTADRLHDTGVVAWVAARKRSDSEIDGLAHELAALLSGPPSPIWTYLGLDADIELAGGSVDVAGWELVVLDSEQLTALLPIPMASGQAPTRPWDPETWAGCAFLRRVDPEATPVSGFAMYLRGPFPERTAWQPVLMLSCWDETVPTVWSEHVVEPARHVGIPLNRVWYDIQGGEDWEVEFPYRSTLGVNPGNEATFRLFCHEVNLLLPDPDGTLWRSSILRAAAARFLAAGEHCTGTAVPFDAERVPDAVLNYVAALEALLVMDGGNAELTRKVAQRAAVLIGTSAAQRLAVAQVVKMAYDARSRWAHGDELPEKRIPDLNALRSICQQTFLSWIAVTATCGAKNQRSVLSERCDEALLSPDALTFLRQPVVALEARIGSNLSQLGRA